MPSLRTPPRRRGAVVTAVALVTLLVGGGPARASDDDEVERRGSCSRGAEWKIKAKPDDGRIEVEGEVESDTRGTWKWRLFHNDSLSAHGTGRTGGSDDSFEVSREMTDLAGVDRFSFRARNTRTGEWCRGPVSL